MIWLLWLLVLISFVIAFIGLLKPVIPAVLFLWIGFIIYQWGIDDTSLSWIFWLGMLFLTLLIFISDLLMNRYFVNRFGGSKKGEWAALIGVILGSFILPPFGIVIVPFILVLIVEMLEQKRFDVALKASFGSIVAFFSSTFTQAFVMLIMVIWFFVDALLIN
ncbi:MULTISPECIES: DUF456 domain-containing protein [Staphylococcus]|uniref:DUF456 domain-containing protein n=2 Tax=Staphylococcus chromogenes TaxID=46126 RepID=A0AAE5W9D8_STACR|nr:MULTISPECIES: DUF456 domain-containing protein [Staphylococcus]KDP13917.1 hypothetical protein SCHR_02065 [Staphylococcus chromogenes MU 970]MBP0045496.1 DUF456 domain-containing protein [Staphylococcus chromogenes]MBV5138109.1 DUF456 domain-containing protein [Staphylococcus chromogenes]MBV5190821.1 DUF456 domain-containing protein [Staphylococcus chromogenes]MBW3131550.1 DUF456 domain-containing protein [Staphylococcus chromogenes]